MNNDSITLPIYGWNLYCTNDKCGGFFVQKRTEPDTICQRCGCKLEVSERIVFKSEEE
jgi:hypothetical protein